MHCQLQEGLYAEMIVSGNSSNDHRAATVKRKAIENDTSSTILDVTSENSRNVDSGTKGNR